MFVYLVQDNHPGLHPFYGESGGHARFLASQVGVKLEKGQVTLAVKDAVSILVFAHSGLTSPRYLEGGGKVDKNSLSLIWRVFGIQERTLPPRATQRELGEVENLRGIGVTCHLGFPLPDDWGLVFRMEPYLDPPIPEE